MTPERLITAATVTTGEKHDRKQLIELIEISTKVGIKITAIIGDGTYSERENLEYCEKMNIKNIGKLSKNVTHGIRENDEFEYNKVAGMYVCKAGHMVITKRLSGSKKRNQ